MDNSKIVYVEDEEDYQMLVSRMLGDAGFKVQVADNGRDGMQLLQKESPGLLLLDINLPDTDGFKICRQLRRQRVWKKLPVVMVTVRRRPEEWLNGFSCGANDYVAKPLNPPDFVERIQACFNGSLVQAKVGSEEAERQVIRAALAGNRGAFDILIKQYRDKLFGRILEQVHNVDEAEDIVANALLRAYKHLDTYDGQSSFFSWFFGIGLNELYNRQRIYKPLPLDEVMNENEEWLPESLIEPDSTSGTVEARIEEGQAKMAMSSIPEEDQKLLEWHLVKKLPCERIAKKLAIPKGTVWSRIAKAKCLLRRAFHRHPLATPV